MQATTGAAWRQPAVALQVFSLTSTWTARRAVQHALPGARKAFRHAGRDRRAAALESGPGV